MLKNTYDQCLLINFILSRIKLMQVTKLTFWFLFLVILLPFRCFFHSHSNSVWSMRLSHIDIFFHFSPFLISTHEKHLSKYSLSFYVCLWRSTMLVFLTTSPLVMRIFLGVSQPGIVGWNGGRWNTGCSYVSFSCHVNETPSMFLYISI